jgi:hypothetical protein
MKATALVHLRYTNKPIFLHLSADQHDLVHALEGVGVSDVKRTPTPAHRRSRINIHCLFVFLSLSLIRTN